MKIRPLLAVLLVVPVVTACGHALTDQKRLIYVTSSQSETLSNGSQIAAASENGSGKATDSYGSGTGADSIKSGSSSTAEDKSIKSGSSSTAGDKSIKSGSSSTAGNKGIKSGSSSGAGSAISGVDAVIAPPTESDIIGMYNSAVLKNSGLDSVEFERVNTKTAGGTQTVSKADVKFNNNSQDPVYDIVNNLFEAYLEPQAKLEIIIINSKKTLMNYSPGDMAEYTTVMDPDLSAADVNSCGIINGDGGRVLSFTAVNYADYDGLYGAFSLSGALITHIDLEYTITDDGFISSSKQIFKLGDGEVLEMDKTYINVGSSVYIRNPN